MKICVLNPSYDDTASPFAAHDPDCDPAPYVPHREDLEFESASIHQASVNRQVREAILSDRYDLFFNLCDGAWDEDRPGIEVVRMLEAYGVPFTGADSAFYEPSKRAMKRVAHYEGVDTPAHAFAFSEAGIETAIRALRTPVVVKHHNGYSSVGMTRDSLCESADAVRRQAARMLRRYGGALIEEFVGGPEYNVLVVESPSDPDRPHALVPVECRLPEGERIKHFDLKWVDWQSLEWGPVEDEGIAAALRDAARRIFVGLGGVSYARCDFRLDPETGRPSFLEINPNCAIFYPPDVPGSADLALRFDPMGAEGFIDRIIECALARAGRRRGGREGGKWRVVHRRDRGYGLVAARDIAEGERVLVGEERPYHLVSRGHVEREWDAEKRAAFARYAWPLSERLRATWSPDPEDWRPLDHSCDPNAWFGEDSGLDIYARRPIARGEAITMDYATFCGPEMEPFECDCGAESCRGVVRGTDAAEAWVPERYGPRVSDYVRSLHE